MFLIAVVFMMLSSIHAQTTLNPGDLVIVTANADGTDNFDFIPLVDIQAGTIIKFTDNAWTPADTLRTNEGTVTWTASADVTKGTVVSYTGATAGDWVKTSGFDIAASGDNILVYQGTEASPSFIYGIGWAKANNWIWTGNNDSDIPDALSVANKTIVQLANFDDNQYNGSTSGTAAQLLAMVAYAPYWNSNDATAYTAYATAFTITATTACTAPYALTATGVTSSSANLGWSTFGTETAWNIEYGVTGFTQGTGTPVTGVTNPYTLNGLSQNTTYQFYVKADCGGGELSTWAGPFAFTTSCGAVTTYPHNETFASYLPSVCWFEGDAGDITAGPTTISATASSWAADGFLNSGSTGAIKINIDAATDNDWIISPEFSIPATPVFRLKYSVGATQFGAATAPTTAWESDDFVQVLISTTYPTNWTVLKTFTDANTPSNLGQTDVLDLSAYAGQNVRIAFRGVEGATNGGADIDFFIDNFIVEAVPSCEAPTALTATSITATGATLGWTAGSTETLWNVEYGVTGFVQGAGTTVTGVTNPYVVSGLTQNTTYQFYVKADCGGSGLSAWAGPFSFTTPYSCPKPTVPTVTNITATTADLGWTNGGTETAWIVYYKTAAATDYTEVTGVTTNPYTLGGLTANTNYIFKVKANCSVSDTSYVSVTKTFTTTCAAISSFPYTESFGSTFPSCWSASEAVAGASYHWATATADATHGVLGPQAGTNFMALNVFNASSTYNPYYLTTPSFTLDATIKQVKYYYYLGSAGNTLSPAPLTVQISTDNGTTWTDLYVHTTANSTFSSTSALTGWIQNTVALTAYVNQTVKLRFAANSNFGSGYCNQGLDEFVIEDAPSCIKPTALTATAITATGATLGWTAGNTETLWNVEYGATGFTQGTGTTVSGVTNPYAITGLTQNTTYQFYVQADCGGSTSTWAGPFSFTTPYSCPKPTVPTVTNITATSADLGWTNGGTETAWIVYYKEATATDYTEVTGVTTNPYNLGGLTPATNYIFKVKANCSVSDSSFASATQTFTTLCNAVTTYPHNEPFTNYLPSTCWTEGDAGDLTAGPTTISSTASSWAADGFLNSGSTGAIRINIDAATDNDWIISPEFTIPAAPIFRLKYSVGATQWNATTAPTTPWESDDYVQVLVSTTYPANWTVLKTFNDLNTPSNLGQIDMLDLSAYAGQTIRIAFRGVEGATDGGADIDFFVDDFTVEAVPTCEAPTALTATAITSTDATLGWTAGGTETLWNVEYGVTGFTQGTGTIANGVSNAYAITGLSQNTTYQFYVQADCAANGTSTWSGPVSFSTPYSCPKPTVPTVANITTTSADLGWTAGGAETSWILYYKKATDPDYTEVTGITSNPYTLGGLTANTGYIFKVKADCSVSDTSFASVTKTFNTACGAVSSLPWTEGFETGFVDATAIAGCWTQASTTGTDTWMANSTQTTYNRTPRTGSFNATLRWGNEDWLFYPFDLTAGTSYTFSFYARQDGSTLTNANISASYGSSATILSMTNPIIATTGLTNGNYQLFTGTFTPTSTGVVYIGIKGFINSSPYYISLDDIRLETTPVCLPPTALTASSITGYDAIIGWTRGTTETAWNVQYGTAGFTLGTGTVISGIADTTYSLADLSGSTTYSFYVQADCGLANGQSSWAGPYTFSTLCVDVNAFSESFTNVTAPALPICWAKVGTGGNVYTQTSSSNTAPNTLYMYTSTATSQAVVSMPKVTNAGANTHWLRFNMRANSSIGGIIEIGYLTNPVDSSSFVPVTTRTASTLTYKEYIVNLGTAPGSNNTLAFRHTGSPAYSLLIDDVKWEPVPACLWPTALTATAIHGTGATLGWTAGGTETAWTVEYGPTGFTQGTGTIANTTTNSYVVTGLTNVTAYQFYVQANCGGSDGSSVWTGPYSFTTTVACPAPTALGANIGSTTTTLQWTPGGIETTWNLEWGPTGFTQGTGTTVIPTTNSYLLTGLTPQTTYQYYVQSACGSTWAGPFSFTTTCIPVSTIPWVESFESGYNDATTVSGCWTQSSVTGTDTWMANSTATTYNRTARTGSFNATLIYSNEDWLFYGFSLTGGTSYSFEMFARQDKSVPSYASIKVAYGSSPTIAAMTNIIKDSTAIINGDYQLINGYFTPATSGDYYIGIRGKISGTPWYISIDDIKLDLAPNCLPPTALNVPSKTSTTATLAWTAGATETEWNVEYGLTGFTQGTGTMVVASANSLAVTSLVPATTYQFYVQANCGGANGTSTWAGPFTFTTACDPVTVFPLTESFDGTTFAPTCWANTQTNAIGTNVWDQSTAGTNPDCTPHSGTGMARFNSFNFSSGVKAELVTPSLNLSNDFYQVSFWMYRDDGYDTKEDLVNVYYNTAPNSIGGTLLGTIHRNDLMAPAVTTPNQWYQYTFNMPTGSAGTYRYVIFEGVSGYGNNIFIDDVTISSATAVCNVPSTLVATNIGETTADLGWTSTAANVNVRYRTVGGTTWTVATATSTPLSVSGLTANTQYEFQVQAVCSATPGDTSDWATAATFTTIVASACPTPTALTATNITLTTADLGWTSTAANFNVRYRIVGAATWTTTTAATTTLPLTGLSEITQYEFQVQAICSATAGDTSNWTSTTSFTTLSSCAAPTALATTSIAQTTATLGWTSTASNFNVRYRSVGSTTWTNATATATTLPVTGLTANTQYEFEVQTVCSATVGDTSAWATAVTFTTLAMPACATPTALAATSIAQTTATLGWTSTAANFNVRYRTVGSTTWTNATATAITLPVTGLTANTQYEFQVQAVCSATAGDTSAWATAATFTTLADATCPEPTALVVSAISEVGATLNWTAGGTETAWNIRYKKVADATYTNIANTSTKPYVLTGLQSSTAYVWNVQAVCSSTLTSAWSADNTFNTTVGIDNNTLTNLSVFSYDNQINVINSGNILVKSVVIYNMIGQEVGTYAINSTDNILVNTNLVIGTYMVKVVTADKVGTYKLFIK